MNQQRCLSYFIEGDYLTSISLKVFGKDQLHSGLLTINKKASELCATIDKAALRSMNRSTQILIYLAEVHQIKKTLSKFNANRLGLYCATSSGCFPYELYEEPATAKTAHWNYIAQALNPQSLFQRSCAVGAAQLGMFLGVLGPTLAFLHEQEACVQAMEQIEFDFQDNTIDLAILATAVSVIDDPYLGKRECGAILIIKKNELAEVKLLVQRLSSSNVTNYGIAQPLMNLKEII